MRESEQCKAVPIFSFLDDLDCNEYFHPIQLEVKQLDLYLIHLPTLIENDNYESTWLEFERFKCEGLTKYVSLLLSLYPGLL